MPEEWLNGQFLGKCCKSEWNQLVLMDMIIWYTWVFVSEFLADEEFPISRAGKTLESSIN